LTDLPPYKHLAIRLDELPNGFPPTDEGIELRLLAYLFTPEEAELAAQLRLSPETAAAVAQRLGREPAAVARLLKGMARKGLIQAGRTPEGLGFGLLPFVVGIYEAQVGRIDAELARLFEDYYRQAFKHIMDIQPAVHRIVPVQEAVKVDLEIQPYESVTQILAQAQSWGVIDCICRKQQALVGKPCGHPVDVCMVFSPTPGAFDNSPAVRALTHPEALAVLHRAAEAGLVHSVSNSQGPIGYICNCCTCACGVLRGMAELGHANVVARSAFVSTISENDCIGCTACVSACQFDAITCEAVAEIYAPRCVGCGLCALACPEQAITLVLRPPEEVKPPPPSEDDWRRDRAAARGIDLQRVL
jgi:ferredoxin